VAATLAGAPLRPAKSRDLAYGIALRDIVKQYNTDKRFEVNSSNPPLASPAFTNKGRVMASCMYLSTKVPWEHDAEAQEFAPCYYKHQEFAPCYYKHHQKIRSKMGTRQAVSQVHPAESR
jgi:hypothetical protein